MDYQEIAEKRNTKRNRFHIILPKVRWIWSTTEYKRHLHFVSSGFPGLLCSPAMPLWCYKFLILETQLGCLKNTEATTTTMTKTIQMLPRESETWVQSRFQIPFLQHLVSLLVCQAGSWEVGYSDERETSGFYPQEATGHQLWQCLWSQESHSTDLSLNYSKC